MATSSSCRSLLIASAVLVAGLGFSAQSQVVETQGADPSQAPAPGGARAGGAGAGRGTLQSDLIDFSARMPYLPRTPEQERAGFRLPPGYRLELVAADPDIISPAVIAFDGDGRMYVSELISYMMDAEGNDEHAAISRISRWESTKHDGVFDRHVVFADRLVAPRLIVPLENGVILTSETNSDDLLKLSDTNGDGVADKKEIVFTGLGQSGDFNIEHQKAGMFWNLDNWLYTTYNAFRVRWTPKGFVREPTGANGGSWGLASDDDGKPWFVNAGGERGPVNFQYPIVYGAFSPCPAPNGRGGGGRGAQPAAAPAAPDPNCPAGVQDGFEDGFATVWPSPGIGDMQGGLNRTRMPAQNLNHFTAATGPAIVRGDRLPEDLRGHLLFTEPVGRLIRRATIENDGGLVILHNAYPNAEFLTSEDRLFRPVAIANAPDGTVYIADMYHGIIQERQWSGPGTYLRARIEQYQLDKVARHGRIWRLRYDGRPAVPATDTNPGQAAIPAMQPDFASPGLYGQSPAQLVTVLTHENGWRRDVAQALLVLKQDKSVVPALQQMVRANLASSAGRAEAAGRGGLLARFHAMWTLEGLGALDAALVREAMKDTNPRMRIQAIRASETLYKAGDRTLADDYRALAKDSDPNVVIQAMLTINLFKLPDATSVIKAAQSSTKARGVALVTANLLAPPAAAIGAGGRGGAPAYTAEEQQLIQQGSQVFEAVCFTCHALDGRGQTLAGAPAGTTMAPALAGSLRVQGHRDYVIKVLLKGVTGPIDGKTYSEVMIPMGENSDAWIAGVASYVRTSFGNVGGPVTAADVARVRAATATRKTPWTVAEVDAAVPRMVDSQTWKLSASHNTARAAAATSIRGWASEQPQAPGMWLQLELPVPLTVAELQFASTAVPGLGGGSGTPARGAAAGGAGAGAAGPPAAPAPAPVTDYPRGYSVTTSMDGTTWSRPVAQGKGNASRMVIVLPPTRAKFIRITQTDTTPNAPAWAMSSLRLYEVPGAAR